MVSDNPRLSSKSEVFRGRMLLVAAAFFWSLSGVLIKSPVLSGVSGPTLACYRALIADVCLAPLVRPSAVRFRPMLIPMVISFAGMNVLFITAMIETTAAAAIFLQYTSTLWAFLFAVIVLREPVDRGNLVTVLFGLAGIGWIVVADWNGERFLGNAIALLSGVAYAGVILSLRQLRHESSAWLIALNHLVSGLVLLPWVGYQAVLLTGQQWILIGILGCVQMALPYVLFARSLKSVSSQEAALIPLLEPLLNPLWVWIFWNEPAPLPTWIGGGLILTGLALRYTVLRGR